MSPDEVLGFWLDKVGQENWYATDEALDSEIRRRFLKSWNELKSGAFGLWLTYPSGACAYIILADQFPRNMFRGSKQAFSSDKAGLSAAKSSIKRGWDLRIDEPARQFFYLPLMHSENLYDQDRCVRLISARMKVSGDSNLTHAKAHREVIRQFGRFPYRNDALERKFMTVEREYLDQGGYVVTLRELNKVS